MAVMAVAMDRRGNGLAAGVAALILSAGYGLATTGALNATDGLPMVDLRPAIGLALLLVWGHRREVMALVVAAAVLSRLGPGWSGWSAGLGAGLGLVVAVWALRGPLRMGFGLRGVADIARLLAGAVLASAIVAVAAAPSVAAFVRVWLAGMVGMAGITPALLILGERLRSGHWGEDGLLRSPAALLSWEGAGLAVAVILSAVILFPNAHGSRFYPAFIPVVWAGARYGLAGTGMVLTVMEGAMAGCVVGFGVGGAHVLKVQILMLSLAVTGLLLGAVVSERERVRQAAARGEARFRAIIDLAPDGMLIADQAGRVEAANRQFEGLFGAPAATIVGRPVREILPDHREGAECVEGHLLRAGGGVLPVETAAATIEIGGDAAAVVTIRDISARKWAEARLGQRRAALEHAARSTLTVELAAVLAHELNQPLAAIVAYIAACTRGLAAVDVPDRAREQLGKAAMQAERAGAVLRRLREFVRNPVPDLEPVAVTDMVDEVRLLLGDQVATLGVALTVAVPPGLTVLADRLEIEQVLMNLIRNGLDSLAQSGSAAPAIRIGARETEGGMAEIWVADTGPGIASDMVPLLFNPFVTTRGAGMGLGLTISRSLVEAHGGRLWADPAPAPGIGARLCFTLRRAGQAETRHG